MSAVRRTRWLCLWTLWLGSLGCAALPIRDPSALQHFEAKVVSEDGWELSLFRLPPAAAASSAPHFGTPVLLAHGTAINRYNFMLTGSDLARFLSDRGFDVWLPELRGDRSSRAPEARIWRRGEWNVDDMARYDVPVVLDHIKSATGRDQVWWVGHSLGGILGYVALQGVRAGDIAGLVAVGSPGSYEHPTRLARRSIKAAAGLPERGQLPARSLARLAVPLIHLAPESNLLHAILNYDNIEVDAMVGFIGVGMENIAIGLVRQYSQWMMQGDLVSVDGRDDYTAGLQKITVPTLLLAGRVDHVVPPWAVRVAFDRIASADKSFVILGRGWGTRHDYGHGDLLVGSRVETEVFPLISEWMERRIAGRDAPTGLLELQVEAEVDPLLDGSDLEDGEPRSDAPGAAEGSVEASGSGP